MSLVPSIFCALLVIHASGAREARSFFSWGGDSEPVTEEVAAAPVSFPGYKPVIQLRKYSGLSVNRLDGGSPLYFESASPALASDILRSELAPSALSADELRNFNFLYEAAAPLLADDRWKELDPSAVLPLVELIPEDSFDRFRFAVENTELTKAKDKSKVLALLAYLKELKLKPFKFVAKIGSDLYQKKKQSVQNVVGFFVPSVTTPVPLAVLPSADPVPAAQAPVFLNYQNYPSSFQQPSHVDYLGGQHTPQLKAGPAIYYENAAPSSTPSSLPASLTQFAGGNRRVPYVLPPPSTSHQSYSFYPGQGSVNHDQLGAQSANYFAHGSVSTSAAVAPLTSNYDFQGYPPQSQLFSQQQQFQPPPSSYPQNLNNGNWKYQHSYSTDLESAASEIVGNVEKGTDDEAPQPATSSAKPESLKAEENPSRTVLHAMKTSRSPVLVFPNAENDDKIVEEQKVLSSERERNSSTVAPVS